MRLVWVVIPLVLLSVIGMQESFSEESKINYLFIEAKNPWYLHYPDIEKPNPKVQLEKGVKSSNIMCRHTHYLIYKVSDHSPTCVNQDNVNKFIQRGWGTIGKSSLVISTDKTQYQIGENIKISMKNQGETILTWSGSPRFSILNQTEHSIGLPITNAVPPFDSMGLLSPDSEISLIWNQMDSKHKQMTTGNYTIQAKYQSPSADSHYIGGTDEITKVSFEIMEPLISIQTDSDNYNEGDLMKISGTVSDIFRTTITLQFVFDGKLIDVARHAVVKDGSFSHTIIVDRKLMPSPGNYTLRATYEENIDETEFTYFSEYDVRNLPVANYWE